jgi:DNA-directed RNA polymerase sigma subunit (sigma70/sigma32)
VLADEQTADPLERECLREWRSELDGLLHGLPAVERSVLSWHYGLDGSDEMTLKAVGDRLGRSRERARQLEEQAFERMRRQVGEFA